MCWYGWFIHLVWFGLNQSDIQITSKNYTPFYTYINPHKANNKVFLFHYRVNNGH